MGQTGFCEDLRFPAGFCENLRFPAVLCENLRLRNAVIPRTSENQRKSAKIWEKLRKTAKLAPFVPFSLSLLIPPDFGDFVETILSQNGASEYGPCGTRSPQGPQCDTPREQSFSLQNDSALCPVGVASRGAYGSDKRPVKLPKLDQIRCPLGRNRPERERERQRDRETERQRDREREREERTERIRGRE